MKVNLKIVPASIRPSCSRCFYAVTGEFDWECSKPMVDNNNIDSHCDKGFIYIETPRTTKQTPPRNES